MSRYIVVEAPSKDELENEVNTYIEQGYMPCGDVTTETVVISKFEKKIYQESGIPSDDEEVYVGTRTTFRNETTYRQAMIRS